MKTVAIIGAGPSGIMTALKLKEYFKNNIKVVLFEKNNRIGKKIIVSGNGKCNITNDCIDSTYIYNNDFAKKIINNYSPKMLKEQLLKWGIFTKTDSSFRVYPLTESSNTVMEMLLLQLKKANVEVKINTLVTKITKNNNIYLVDTLHDDQKISYKCDYVVVATGGTSSKVHGSNGEGYSLLQKLGIDITKVRPGLVGLKINNSDINGLSGIRHKVCAKLFEKDICVFSECGEVQFKNDGISGIVIMNASSIIARKKEQLRLVLDLIPNFSVEELLEKFNLILKNNNGLCFEELTHGILPKVLAIKICNMLKKINDLNISSFINLAKNYSLDVTGTYGFDSSQVSVGGVCIDEVDNNLELKKYKNLYVVGELLDVDGLCGGYNMHFAFATGAVVGDSIYIKEEKNYE